MHPQAFYTYIKKNSPSAATPSPHIAEYAYNIHVHVCILLPIAEIDNELDAEIRSFLVHHMSLAMPYQQQHPIHSFRHTWTKEREKEKEKDKQQRQKTRGEKGNNRQAVWC